MTVCPSGQGDGPEIHWALPAGVRIPSVSHFVFMAGDWHREGILQRGEGLLTRRHGARRKLGWGAARRKFYDLQFRDS